MIEGEIPGIEEYHQRELAAQEGQYQGVRHGAHHVPSDVHSGLEQLVPVKGRISRVHLFNGGGYAHGHVHYRAQGTDYDAGHQKSSDIYCSAVILQLDQRFRVLQPQSVYLGDVLADQSEDHGKERAGDRTQKCAYGFSVYSSEDGKAHQRNIGANYKGGGYRLEALQYQRYQNGEQAQKREHQTYQRLQSYPSSYEGYHYEEEHDDPGHDGYPVELIDGGGVFAALVGLDGECHSVPHFHRHAVIRAEIVEGGHGLALVASALHYYREFLHARRCVFYQFIDCDIVIHYLHYCGFLEFHYLVAVGPEYVVGVSYYVIGIQPEKGAEKYQQSYCQHYYALFISDPGLVQCFRIIARFLFSTFCHYYLHSGCVVSTLYI